MVCEHCYGKGERGSVTWPGTKVCPECQGSGIVSCCDTAGASADVSVESLFDGMRMIRETFKANISGAIVSRLHESDDLSVVKDSTEARPLTKEEADEFKRKHFKPRNALYPGSPASW